MNKSKGWSSLPGKLLILTLVFALLTGLFYWVVAEDWRRSAVETDMVSASGLAPLKEGAENRVTQGFTVQMDRLTALRLIPGRMRLEPAGEIGLRILSGERVLWEHRLPVDALTFDTANVIRIEPALEDVRALPLTLELDLGDSGVSFQRGSTMTAGKLEVEVERQGEFRVNGEAAEGQLVLGTNGELQLDAQRLVLPAAAGLYLLAVLFLFRAEKQRRTGRMNLSGRITDIVTRYRYLLKTLVTRDFRIKYQASLLGVLWSFLNPLLTMFVYLFVFSTIFRQNIEYFPVYLLCGIVLFNYFSESTSLGLASIVSNRALITKVYMPKYIYPVAKVLSSAINLIISFIPLIIVMLTTGVPFHRSLLLLPVVLMFIIAFCTGVSLILATMNVFFRDTQFLWGILLTIWNFMTPIFYPESIIPAAYRTLYHMNPMYQIVYFMRCITIGGVSPTPATYAYCALGSFVPLLLGLLIFRWKQDQFVLHL